MRLTPLALAALLLAGCVEPPAAPPGDPVPVPQEKVRYERPVGVSISAKSAVVCPPQVSCFQTSSELLLELRGNETATGFRLDVTASETLPPATPFHIEVRCAGTRGCSAPLAQHDGVAQFTLESDVSLPPLSVLTVEARSLDDTPDPLGILATFIRVDGVVGVEAVPGPPPRLVATELHLRGVAGTCGFIVEANCTSWPNGSEWSYALNGTLRHVDLTAAWTPLTPASETMRLEVVCDFNSDCPPMRAEGGSPLRLTLAPADVPPTAILWVRMGWTTPLAFPARQEVAIDGILQSTQDA